MQNNEAEALRAWRNALDQIYYHNAYKIPSNYSPKSETEKALADSLKAMELQCKERVDLLEALKKSRLEAAKAEKEAKAAGVAGPTPSQGSPFRSRESLVATTPSTRTNSNGQGTTWLGNNTVPQATYANIPRPPPTPERRPPAQPARPSYTTKKSSHGNETPRNMSMQTPAAPSPLLTPPVNASGGDRPRDRTPSPEKKNGMLKTLRSGNAKEGRSSSSKMTTTLRSRPQPAAASAAALSWSKPAQQNANATGSSGSITTWDPLTRTLVRGNSSQQDARRASDNSYVRPPSPSDFRNGRNSYDDQTRGQLPPYPDYPVMNPFANFDSSNDIGDSMPPPPPPHRVTPPTPVNEQPPTPGSMADMPRTSLSYMKEYPNNPPIAKRPAPPVPSKPSERRSDSDGTSSRKANRIIEASQGASIPRKAVGRAAATAERQKLDSVQAQLNSRTRQDPQAGPAGYLSSSPDLVPKRNATKKKIEGRTVPARAMTPPTTDDAEGDSDLPGSPSEQDAFDARVKQIMKKLPKGVDETAAKQIFNEIVIKGDEVHWDDVAGLEIAKSALKETVVYPFLRPDLFMGLREPARGMLLFGPPGTGKTMLARAVATESKSVFFAISASSLTSKFLGESEKLVRALFVLAKELAPSIIFVDEIDSLLGSRGGSSEHEATRRIKTEFLIQWSDLQKAAAGRETTGGDATRVLVLAATNLPWAIDEAARRRFVRRAYIPLPEDWVREKQLRTLLSAQKHNLRDRELRELVRKTDGFSGSDITALAKDAAMGPLRSLGEKLLEMSPEDIRPIGLQDFEASLVNIRPSVSKQGLQEFEDWAREFGERGG